MEVVAVQDRNALGFFSWYGYDLPFDERLRHIRKAGFTDVSIWLGIEEQFVAEKQPNRMCEAAAKMKLHIECAHAPYTNCNDIWDSREKVREGLFEEIAACVRFCSSHSIPILVMHASKGDNPPIPNENGLMLLRKLVVVAEAQNVITAIENTRKVETFDYVLSAIDSPFLGFCYDSSHDFLYSKPPGAILKRWGHRLTYTHFSDNDGNADRHWIPGKGIINWEIIRTSFPRDWPGRISLEVVPQSVNDEGIDDFLEESVRKGLWLQRMLRE